MMLAASLIGIASGVIGIYLSYYAGIAAGASIAACIVVAYLAAIAAAGARGLLDRLALSDPRPGSLDESA
jgi:ABC-type Mn2+/Zn2+ transport system permease subunit